MLGCVSLCRLGYERVGKLVISNFWSLHMNFDILTFDALDLGKTYDRSSFKGDQRLCLSSAQGEQFGQIFANWAIVWSTYFPCKSYASILTKYGLCYILGDISANSSGHPGSASQTGPRQGCPMVYFKAKNLGKFWRFLQWKILVHFMAIYSFLLPFGIFCGHLVYFVAIWYTYLVYFVAIWYIWYILWPFGIFYSHLQYFFPFWSVAPIKIWQPWSTTM
jgi:hypothetical protein